MSAEAAIECRALSVSFGGLAAVRNVSLVVQPGERRALIGPNGAGKTTLFHLISGQRRPSHGRVLLGGHDVTELPAHQRSRLGLARTFQFTNLLPGLSVFDNVHLATMARYRLRYSLYRPTSSYGAEQRETERVLEEWDFAAVRDLPVRDLAHGEQRRLEIVLALAARPRTVLLDEPFAGLAPAEAARVGATIAALPRSLTLLLIDHDTEAALSLVDSVSVMSLGRIVAVGTPAAIRADASVREIYFGAAPVAETRSAAATARGAPPNEDGAEQPALAVDGVHTYYGRSHVLQGVDLQVRSGEVVALLGRNGAGKTTLVHTIAGLLRPAQGEVRVAGHLVSGLQPEEVAAAGVALVPQGRRLFGSLSVEENLAVAFRDAGPRGWTPRRVFRTIPVLAERRPQAAGTLSGGEQQLAAAARALVRNAAVLLLDEPSEGLAPAMLTLLAELIRAERDRGAAILLVEQKLGFALSLADRAAAMARGRIVYACGPGGLSADNADLRRHIGL